jgi:hypothetical protein
MMCVKLSITCSQLQRAPISITTFVSLHLRNSRINTQIFVCFVKLVNYFAVLLNTGHSNSLYENLNVFQHVF